MKKCNHCQVDIKTTKNTCPLCGEILQSIDEKSLYTNSPYPPFISKKRLLNPVLRILIFISVIAMVVSTVINRLTYDQAAFPWSFIVIGAIIYIWIFFITIIKSKSHITFKIITQTLVISLLVLAIQLISNTGYWAFEYVIPAILTGSTLSMIALFTFNLKRRHYYILPLIIVSILDLIPFICYLFLPNEYKTVFWTHLTILIVGLATIFGLFIITPRTTINELKKRFFL
ncbi:MAG: hypothetical protein GX312_04330 [Candidatus Phytoplasma sp.]|nr:hypothetical protein [Phytoplasma sp.]